MIWHQYDLLLIFTLVLVATHLPHFIVIVSRLTFLYSTLSASGHFFSSSSHNIGTCSTIHRVFFVCHVLRRYYSIKYLQPHEQYEKTKRYDTERWLPKLVDAQYATGEEQRNSSRRNEESEAKGKQHPGVDVSGSKVTSEVVKNNIA